MSEENKTPEEAAQTPNDTVVEAPAEKKPEAAKSATSSDGDKKPEAAAQNQGGGRGRGGNNAQKKVQDNPLSDKPLERKGRGGKGGGGRGGRGRGDKQQKEFQEILLEVRRVTRVTTGGRQLAFRAIIVIGNGKGKIGLGVAKGNDVQIAVRKATHEAYKNIVQAPITEELTVPYGITHKYKSAIIKLMPATVGTGMKAGSSVRTVLELAGYNNILSKIIGTNNKLNNAIAAIQALAKYKVGKTPPKQGDEKKEKGEKVDNKKIETKKTDGKKVTTTGTKNSGGDDLSKIEGVGPKIAELLVTNGITSYIDLSKADTGVLTKLLEVNKLSQHNPATRADQAKLAATGKWDELKTLQDALDGGKVVA